MRKLVAVIAALAAAGCGANYSPNSDLPTLGGSTGVSKARTTPAGVCAVCNTNDDCGPNSFCASEDDTSQHYCTSPCASDGTCDDGQTCFTVDGNGDTGCYPSNGSCLNPPVIDTSTSGTTGTSTTGTSTSTTSGSTGTTSTSGTTSSTTATSTTSSSTTSSTSGSTGTTSTSTTSSSTTSTSSTSGTTGNTCTPDTWSNWAQGWFQSNCAGCHYSGGQPPNLTSHTTVKNNASSIQYQVDHGYMPQGRSLSSADISRLDTYLGCGAP